MRMAAIWAGFTVVFLVADMSMGSDIADLAERARRNASSYGNMELPERVTSGGVQAAAARKSFDYLNGKEFRQRFNAETERLKRYVFDGKDDTLSLYYGNHAADSQKKGKLAADERVYIFVSSSVPEETLRAYARDIDKAGDPNVFMVIRGFVGGSGTFAPTMKFISRVLLKNPDCIDVSGCPSFAAAMEIDPNLYRRFRPERVPAVAFVRGVRPSDAERSEGDPTNIPKADPGSWWMLYGDSSLSYAFSRINEEAHSSGLEELSKAIAR